MTDEPTHGVTVVQQVMEFNPKARLLIMTTCHGDEDIFRCLTQRELDPLQQVALGRSNKDIARRLNITEGTAKTHVKSILTKLDAISRAEAVAAAHKRGRIHL